MPEGSIGDVGFVSMPFAILTDGSCEVTYLGDGPATRGDEDGEVGGEYALMVFE